MSDEILAEASRLSNAAFDLFERGEFEVSISTASQALELRLKVLDPAHLLIARSYGDLAVLLRCAGDEVMSTRALDSALYIYELWLGQLHGRLQTGMKADLLSEVGALYDSLARHQTALDYYTFALSHYRTARDRENEVRILQLIDELATFVRSADEQDTRGPVKPELVVQTGHTITSEVAFSPDGLLLATGGSDNMVKLWEVSTGRILRTLYGAQAPVVFSRDGRLLVTGDARGMVTLWDVITGERQEMRPIPYERTYPVFAVAISPDGGTVVTGHGDGAINSWDTVLKIETGRLGRHGTRRHEEGYASDEAVGEKDLVVAIGSKLSVEGREVRSVAFSPRGHIVASGGDDWTIKLWSFPTGRLLRELTGHTAFVFDLAFSPDGRRLASSGGWDDKTVRIWDVATGQTLHVLDGGHTNIVSDVAFSPNGRLLAAGSFDMVKVWDAVEGREALTLKDAKGDAAFSPDGLLLATQSGGFQGNTVTLWDVATGREVRTLGGNMRGVRRVAFSRDVRWLAAQGNGSTVLWELGSDRAPFNLSDDGADKASDGLAFDPGGSKLATLLSGGGVRVWSLTMRRELFSLQVMPGPDGSNNWITKFAFSPDGSSLATGESDGTIKLWDAETGQELSTLATPPPQAQEKNEGARPPEGAVAKNRLQELIDDFKKLMPGVSVSELAFSPDGSLLASIDSDNEVTLRDAKTGNVLQAFSARAKSFGHAVNALAFSPDGRQLATGDINGSIIFWDVATCGAQHRLDLCAPPDAAHSMYSVARLVYGPGGRRLASLAGGEAMVFDLEARSGVLSIAGQAGLSDLDWSSDGRLIVTASFDGTTRFWDASTCAPLVSLVSFREDNDWLVIMPDGLFDGTPEAWSKILWRFKPDTFDVRPVEVYFNEFYYPDLLADIAKGRNPKAKLEIADKDRRQPQLRLTLDGVPSAALSDLTSRTVTVKVEVTEAPSDENHPSGSGVRDVRLFRNGILVKTWRGEVALQDGGVELKATIPIIAGENRLTAYAFNHDNIKSTDASLLVKGAECLKRQGTLYILTVGVNKYVNPRLNLNYAVPDAVALSEELRSQQEDLGNYAQVKVIPLLDQDATKANILAIFERLAGASTNTLPAGSPPTLSGIDVSQPEDAVFIYFAGHGIAQGQRFYLLMYDYNGEFKAEEFTSNSETVISSCISDAELEQALAGVDAGHLLLVIDACNSGQVLESEEKRRGPMNSKGLAQLAYEKGMYILTATQNNQAALEPGEPGEGHGLLLEALIRGLRSSDVDQSPKDGQVTGRELFDYAVEQVPQILRVKYGLKGYGKFGQNPRLFYRREAEAQPFIVAKREPLF